MTLTDADDGASDVEIDVSVEDGTRLAMEGRKRSSQFKIYRQAPSAKLPRTAGNGLRNCLP